MFSLATIDYLAREAAEKAAKKKLVPFLVEKEDLRKMPPFPFPNLGDYRPPGWELIDEFFVDHSGWGKPGERALTAKQFLAKIEPGFGYGIIEQGEFQLWVGKFRQKGGKDAIKDVSKRAGHSGNGTEAR